jgi:hypothetical protein
MARRRVSVQWTPPPQEATTAFSVDESVFESLNKTHAAPTPSGSPVPAPSNIFNRIVRKYGTPRVEGAKSPKEDAIGLLQLAAEIEHSLMVQYLYAAASVRPGTGVSARNKVLGVAVQEMGHLMAVQNLLLLVGGPDALHFGRDGIRAGSANNPIPLVLEPVSATALAKFIVAEMPATIGDDALRQRVEGLMKIAEKSAGTTPHRVGALYAKLFWLFQPDDRLTPPLNLVPDEEHGLFAGWHLDPKDFTGPAVIAEFQATRGEWVKSSVPRFILSTVASTQDALDLIATVSEQGEGLGDAQDSHFYEFLELLDDLGTLPITTLPVNPVARSAPAPDAGTTAPIQSPYAKLWAELFDVRYNLLLLDLWHAASTPTSSPKRRALIALAFANMGFVWQISEQLLQIRETHQALDAAPPFGLKYEDLPGEEVLRWQRHALLIGAQAEILREIRSSPEFQDCSGGQCEILDFDGNIRLGNIEQSDAARRALIPPVSPPS